MKQCQQQDVFKLMPTEPTEAMYAAARNAERYESDRALHSRTTALNRIGAIYRAMIAAAPECQIDPYHTVLDGGAVRIQRKPRLIANVDAELARLRECVDALIEGRKLDYERYTARLAELDDMQRTVDASGRFLKASDATIYNLRERVMVLEGALSGLLAHCESAGVAATKSGGVGAFRYEGTEYEQVTIARAALENTK